MIPNPYYLLAVVLFSLGTYMFGVNQGWEKRNEEMQATIAKKDDAARVAEQKIRQLTVEHELKLQEANDAITQTQNSLDAAIAAGRLRLPSSGVQTSAGTASTTGDRNEASSESDRQVLSAIAGIVADGDRNTAQLNSCIDEYNAVRGQVNGVR